MRLRFVAGCFVLALAIGVSGGALAQDIEAGTDCWETKSGSTADLPALPPNFFFAGSDAHPGGPITVRGVNLTGSELANCACEGIPAIQWFDQHLKGSG